MHFHYEYLLDCYDGEVWKSFSYFSTMTFHYYEAEINAKCEASILC